MWSCMLACTRTCVRICVCVFDAHVAGGSKIVFMTEGILLRMLSSDPQLSKFSVIVLDEVQAGLAWLAGWAGLGWAGLGWAGLGWAGLGWHGMSC